MRITEILCWISLGLLIGAWGYMAITSDSNCEIVIKADSTKSAAEVVTEFQELVKDMDRG